jgi:hypothetical protein
VCVGGVTREVRGGGGGGVTRVGLLEGLEGRVQQPDPLRQRMRLGLPAPTSASRARRAGPRQPPSSISGGDGQETETGRRRAGCGGAGQ